MSNKCENESKIEIKVQLFKLPEMLGRAFCNSPTKAALSGLLSWGFSSLTSGWGRTCSDSNASMLEMEFPTAWNCCSVVRSYYRKAFMLLWPVTSATIFSGTPDWNILEADVARRLWFVYFTESPASSETLAIMFLRGFTPTGIFLNHGWEDSAGSFCKGCM